MNATYGNRQIAHLPQCLDFKNGTLYPNERPGLGVELDMSKLKQIAEITDMSVSHVGVILHEAVTKLRTAMAGQNLSRRR